ncbi:MAG: glycosyltransferase family 87 protein [Gemmatimonadaceae bacterium]
MPIPFLKNRTRGEIRVIALYLLIAIVVTIQHSVGKATANNFLIFRASFWHLVNGQDIYAWYLQEHWDLLKYSPTCALLFAPFAVLPIALGLLCWNLLNVGALTFAMLRLLPGRAGIAALLIALLEAIGSIQVSQSNALVAGLIIMTVLALEQDQVALGATSVIAGASIKLFPLTAGIFGLLTPMRWRHIAWCAVTGVVFVLLPLIVTSPANLQMQYHSWFALQAQDNTKTGMAWMGGIIELALHRGIPHLPVQAFGAAVIIASAWFARNSWSDPTVRRLLLASLLIFSVVFNHMAESPSFVIAFAGIGIWWACLPRERWRDATVLMIVLLGSVGGSEVTPRHIRDEWHRNIQLKAIVTLIGWFALQFDIARQLRSGAQPVLAQTHSGEMQSGSIAST